MISYHQTNKRNNQRNHRKLRYLKVQRLWKRDLKHNVPQWQEDHQQLEDV